MIGPVLRATALVALPWAAALPPAAGTEYAPAQPRAGAADTVGSWDGSVARRLAASAVRARRHAYADSTLRRFRASAQGHVYFLAEIGPDAEEAQLVRADQVALQVLWQAPDRSLQTLVGRRSEKRLPTRIRYHIDHLSVVLDNFGDRISLGEGTEVRDVLHPAAPGALEFYEYRLADSLEIRIPGRTSKLYRIEVRPREPERPGIVGEVFIEEASRAVARMRFAFTSAAYRDPSVRRIEVDLASALWDGRHWLPAEQSVTIRRRLSWLSFPLAGVIKTHLEIDDYRINPERAFTLSRSGRVASLPRGRLAEFDGWKNGLYEAPFETGARDPVDFDEARRRAREIAKGSVLSGGSRISVHYPNASSVVRARRSEGTTVGAGARYRLDEERDARAWAGYATEAELLEWRIAYEGPALGGRLEVEGYGDRWTDVGPFPAAAGLISTFGFLEDGEDFTDPYFRDGAAARLRLRAGGGELRLGLTYESHASARLVALPPGGGPVRPVRPVREGELGALRLAYRLPAGSLLATRWSVELGSEGATGAVGDFGFTRGVLRLSGDSEVAAEPFRWRVRGGLAAAGGDVPPQRLLLLGGRGTVPGYPFRSWGGDRAAYLRLTAARDVVGSWARLRAVGAVGWTELSSGSASRAAATANLGESGGPRPSLGAGLGFVDGVIRLDAVRGLDGGGWEWIVSIDPKFAPML